MARREYAVSAARAGMCVVLCACLCARTQSFRFRFYERTARRPRAGRAEREGTSEPCPWFRCVIISFMFVSRAAAKTAKEK